MDNVYHICMNFVGLGPTTMIVLTRSKPCLGNKSLRNAAKKDQNLAPSMWYYPLDHLN